MRQSQLFLKTAREAPKDEAAVNAKLLIRANFIHKLMAGVYSMLPLGFRVREKVIAIIRDEMDKLGAEMLMPALHPRAVWDATGRWEGMAKVMYQFKDHGGRDVGLGPTHEEVIAEIAKSVIASYQDLPKAIYQIQTKFRDEERPKSGLLRGREFTMKDLYSFHADAASLEEYYDRVKDAYHAVFKRAGLVAHLTEASGGDFSKYSHEFMVEADAGEDSILLCRLCGFARNTEIADEKKKDACPKCKEGVLEAVSAIEVGNIFKLGTRFSEPVGLVFKDEKGGTNPVIMASYGIGVERLIGTIAEIHHDDKGLMWPEEVAPFAAHLLMVGADTDELHAFADNIYNDLAKKGIEVLYDDRTGVSAGEKFADADLIGIPWRVVASERTQASGKVEVKKRSESDAALMKLSEFVALLKK
ncbi:MAG: aminoacyl--tRNA ligase-related protein [Candidatus Brennerbacteria bacterium]